MRLRVPVIILFAATTACGGLPAEDDPRPVVCGDGWRSGDEECDDGAGNADLGSCTLSCRIARCGDGLLGPEETCDDPADERCQDCRSLDDSAWLLVVEGAESLAATPGSVFVAGELLVDGAPSPAALLRIDGVSGGVAASGDWGDIEAGASSWRGDLSVAARDGGGAVVGAGFSYDGGELVAVLGFFDAAAGLEARHESIVLAAVDRGVDAIAIGPNGAASIAGSWNEDAWVAEIAVDGEVWSARHSPGASILTATVVDVDQNRGIVAGGDLAGEGLGWIAMFALGGSRVWEATAESSILAVRVDSAATFRLARADGARVLVDDRSLSDGDAASTNELELPSGTVIAGVRLLTGGRVLSFGRAAAGSWLALHEADGAIAWRANPSELRATVVDADASSGWVYALVGGVTVAGWEVGDVAP